MIGPWTGGASPRSPNRVEKIIAVSALSLGDSHSLERAGDGERTATAGAVEGDSGIIELR